MKITCDICGKVFDGKIKTQKRCSANCRKEYRRLWMFERIGDKSWRKEVKCIICGDIFYPNQHNSKMCGKKQCKNEYSKLHMRKKAKEKTKKVNNLECVVCKKNITTIGKSKVITCSKKCSLKNKINGASNRPYRKKPEFKIYSRIRTTLNTRIKGEYKSQSTSSICDYTPKQLKRHLELMFNDGMSWENYGIHGWHIDHIRPLSSFTFFDKNGKIVIENVREAMSLKNLQPLWAKDNLSKSNKY